MEKPLYTIRVEREDPLISLQSVKNIEKDEIYPLFLYSRNYEVEVDSYQKEFPGVTEYYENNSTFIIIGVLLIILFSSIALVAFIFLNVR